MKEELQIYVSPRCEVTEIEPQGIIAVSKLPYEGDTW